MVRFCVKFIATMVGAHIYVALFDFLPLIYGESVIRPVLEEIPTGCKYDLRAQYDTIDIVIRFQGMGWVPPFTLLMPFIVQVTCHNFYLPFADSIKHAYRDDSY